MSTFLKWRRSVGCLRPMTLSQCQIFHAQRLRFLTLFTMIAPASKFLLLSAFFQFSVFQVRLVRVKRFHSIILFYNFSALAKLCVLNSGMLVIWKSLGLFQNCPMLGRLKVISSNCEPLPVSPPILVRRPFSSRTGAFSLKLVTLFFRYLTCFDPLWKTTYFPIVLTRSLPKELLSVYNSPARNRCSCWNY